jgi:DNA polymerase III epsilon subunit-like protein
VITIFDTETSDVVNDKRPMGDPCQPHIASVAAVCYTDDGSRELHSVHLYIRPENWSMNPGASKVNGLTNEFLAENGIDLEVALTVLDHLFYQSRAVFAFNSQFDEKMYNIECSRKGRASFLDRKIHCAMLPFVALLRLPHAYPQSAWYPGEFKWPKLNEVYQHCFSCDIEKAHDGLADVRATAAVLYHAHTNGWFDMFKIG